MIYKQLYAWVANNWRPYCTTKLQRNTTTINYLEIVYRTRKQEVIDELKIMLNVETIDLSKGEAFTRRRTAAKRVWDRMNAQEMEEIMQLVESYNNEGNDDETRL
jgi:hypothetical protein